MAIEMEKSILIVVDDEADLVHLFSEALTSYGYSVIGFTDPIAALSHVKQEPFKYNLLITDYRMPKLNGCELGLKLKELNNNIKVILISAYENIEDNKLNFKLYHKPIPVKKLIAIVDDQLKMNE
jgi:DNA-binding NtrC family response regulator